MNNFDKKLKKFRQFEICETLIIILYDSCTLL